MGGKCYICGYDRCNAAFDLHHINPEEKKFSFGGIRANPVAWQRIVEELKKCIMLCANCHREVENGLVELVNPRSTFDESNIVTKIDWKGRQSTTGKYVHCIVCGLEINNATGRRKFCSDVCKKINTSKQDMIKKRHRDRPRKVQWPERDELAHMIDTMSWIAIGRKYGVSDNAVRKWARKYGLI